MADFNSACAQWVYDTISKMDDAEAESFSLFMVHDLWTRDMEANERWLRGHQLKQDQLYTDDVAKALLGHLEAGEDPEEAVAIAAAVAVAKADHDWYKFQEREPNGRFGRMTGAQYRAAKKGVKADRKVAEADREKALADLKAQRRGYLTGSKESYSDVRAAGRAGMEITRNGVAAWDKPTDNESGATDTFNRLAAGGQVVQQVGATTGSPKLAVAGAVANYAGQFGPEAEKVVGPSMRKAAYRYRGTERTPDPIVTALGRTQAQGINRAMGRDSSAPMTAEERAAATESAAVIYLKGGYQAANGDRAKGRIASARLAELHRQSGRVTPSEGILIDRNGRPVAQAVGFAEDHYLPFNLKNMSALKGGSYVRTRQSGGLTSEDLYAGLVGGARSMTVVSNSGTFTVELADDLRGGRRYSDKARGMVQRYQKTLDAVQSEKVRKMPISREERYEVADEVEEFVRDAGIDATPEQIDSEINRRILERQSRPKLTQAERSEAERRASRGLPPAPNRTDADVKDYQRALTQVQRQMLREKGEANYRLDGKGYEAALEAMQEQYPYFIKKINVVAADKSPEDFGDGNDLGYVKPRFLRPTAAREGYFGEGIGSPKVSAERTNYANYRNRNRRGGDESGGGADAPKGPDGNSPAGGKSLQDMANDKKLASENAEGLKKETESVQAAADYWNEAIKAGGGLNSPQVAALNAYASATDKAAYVKDNAKKMRDAISYMETTQPRSAANAPKVVVHTPKAPQPPTDLGRATQNVDQHYVKRLEQIERDGLPDYASDPKKYLDQMVAGGIMKRTSTGYAEGDNLSTLRDIQASGVPTSQIARSMLATARTDEEIKSVTDMMDGIVAYNAWRAHTAKQQAS